MKEVTKAIYTALRDDAEATYGIRALLGNTTTSPYNIYYSFLPSNIDFSSTTAQSYITFIPVSTVYDDQYHGKDARAFEMLWQFTVWSRSIEKCYDIINRIKWRLDKMESVNAPTADVEIYKVHFSSVGPEDFDDGFKVHAVVCQVRVWGRDGTYGR